MHQCVYSQSKGAPEPQAEVLVDDVSVKGEDEELKLQQQREAAMADIEFQRELEVRVYAHTTVLNNVVCIVHTLSN